MEPIGQISPDGESYWDGRRWVSTLSPDGQWKWDGSTWAPAASAKAANSDLAPISATPGIRTGAVWKLPLMGLVALIAIGVIGSYISQPQPAPTAQVLAQASPSTAAKATISPSPLPSLKPSPSPSPKASPTPSQAAVAAPAPPPPPPPAPPPPAQNTCGAPANPWGYNFCGGKLIYNPPSNFCSYFNCIPSFWKSTNGYVDQCNDGMFSHSGGQQGACSYHGGEKRPLYSP